jgi:hypothetical protein
MMANRLPHVKLNIQSKRFTDNLTKFGGMVGEMTEVTADLALEKAREYVAPHNRSGALYSSLRIEESKTRSEVRSFNIRMGGTPETKNSVGDDYAGYFEFGTIKNPPYLPITHTLEWIRSSGLDKAVQLQRSKMEFEFPDYGDRGLNRNPISWAL